MLEQAVVDLRRGLRAAASVRGPTGVVELRLPWGLLNFTDPSSHRVLDHPERGLRYGTTTTDRVIVYATLRDAEGVEIDRVDSGPFLSGVAADLESAFGNLLSNAFRYTPEGGEVSVSWRDSDGGPQLIVEDTGIGIPKRDIPRLTERFYRVGSDRARQSGGTGLGLSIVKHVLNAHQASLQIESEPGEGSRFSCTFPRERRRDQPDQS